MMILSLYKKTVAILILLVMILCNSISIVCAKLLKDASTTIELVPYQANELTPEKINDQIRQYILSHPEVIIESIEIMQQKQQQQEQEYLANAISEQLKILYDTHNLPMVGNAHGDIIITIFYDYNCKYCKLLNNIVNKLIVENEDIKIILVPLTILGGLSEHAAKIALAVYEVAPSKFHIFHNKIMSLTKVTLQDIQNILVEAEIDVDKVNDLTNSHNIQNILSMVNNIASKCNLNGVPLTVIGNRVYTGLVDKLQQGINEAREKNKAAVCPLK
ncbi:DsbA family protein [Orientia tsutsugamushi]|uniref:DsbA family protein n=1 Tax=Orientia tsutsugamushi TaxID=784 RepID=UPI0007E3DE1B|nr:DsbA family protein [Orientia tsutsugamushi]